MSASTQIMLNKVDETAIRKQDKLSSLAVLDIMLKNPS